MARSVNNLSGTVDNLLSFIEAINLAAKEEDSYLPPSAMGLEFDENLVKVARDQAARDAMGFREQQVERQISEILTDQENSPYEQLEPIRENIKMARKPTMRTVEHYLCDRCDKVITTELDGFVIHGNIYTAKPNSLGGLVGNNFPETTEDGMVAITSIRKTVLCYNCLQNALKPKDVVKPVPQRNSLHKENVQDLDFDVI